MSIEDTIKKLIMRSRSSVDREFIPPTLFEIEPSQTEFSSKKICIQYLSWPEWRTHPKVREAVSRACPKCAQIWMPACDTLAKGLGRWETWYFSMSLERGAYNEVTPDRMLAKVPLTPPEAGCEKSYLGYWQDETGPGFPIIDLPTIEYATTASQKAYTPDAWYGPGGYPSMGGIWARWAGDRAQEVMTRCGENATTAAQCRFWADGAAGVWTTIEDGSGGPSNLEVLIHDHCTGVSSCCSPAGDFGGFECDENTTVESCTARGGVFHQGKSCDDIQNNNCGGA